MTAVTVDTLSGAIEFDSPFRVVLPTFTVDDEGAHRANLLYGSATAVIETTDRYAPEDVTLTDGVLGELTSGSHATWTALDGFSGQYGYAGPCMHASEQLGGAMAADVLATPGVYVLLIVTAPAEDCEDETCDHEDGDHESEAAGWILARLDES